MYIIPWILFGQKCTKILVIHLNIWFLPRDTRPAWGCVRNLQCVKFYHMKQKHHPTLRWKKGPKKPWHVTHKRSVFHTEWIHHMNSMRYVFWTDPSTSSLLNVKYIEFHFHTVVLISFQIVKNIFLFGTEKVFWDGQYILGNDREHSYSIASIWR